MAKRKLSADEKKEVREKIEARERVAHPGHIIKVHVKDETDDKGEPQVNITRMKEGG